jgi:hypothetical protein
LNVLPKKQFSVMIHAAKYICALPVVLLVNAMLIPQ